MGSNETASALPGGPRVIDVFDGNGAPSGPNYLLFWMQIGSWRPLEVGLVVGKRLHCTRHRCSSLGLSESPGSKIGLILLKAPRAAERIRSRTLEAAA